ncbi:VOC family protein [Lysobacter humi (ex Lee et al. 2017)]
MSGPAPAGVFVYAKDLAGLARFYERVLGMRQLHVSSEHVVLASPHLQLVVHAIPEPIARHIEITVPPQRREESAIKFFHSVSSIAEAADLVASLGGEIFPERWSGPGFTVSNAMDPEGNVFQVRESAP